MDIVKSRIENLSGTVDVRSVPGQGTTFTIRLPLTLAIMSSLLVRIYEEIYAIPLDHIDEIVEVRPSSDLSSSGPSRRSRSARRSSLLWLSETYSTGVVRNTHQSHRNG